MYFFIYYFFFLQFREPPPKIPYKAIGLAIFLFSLGTILLTIGSLLFTGYFDVEVFLFFKLSIFGNIYKEFI